MSNMDTQADAAASETTLASPQSGDGGSQRSISAAFIASCDAGRDIEAAAREMLQQCAKQNIPPTTAMHHNALVRLSRKGPPEATLAWFARMQHDGIVPSTTACNIAMRCHAQTTNLPAAIELLTSMMRQADSCCSAGLPPPDEVSFNTVISALAHAKQPYKAEALLLQMIDLGRFEPSAVTFTSVISGFTAASRPTEASKWLKRMLQTKAPDTIAFNVVLNAFANAGDAKGAMEMMSLFELCSMDECPNAAPDLVSFNTLIHACARAGQPANAESSFNRLVARGLSPDQKSYSSVVHAHAVAGQPVLAEAWLRSMQEAGIAVDAIAYNSVCSAHGRVGDVQSSVRMLGEMEAAGVGASAETHAIMVNALLKDG